MLKVTGLIEELANLKDAGRAFKVGKNTTIRDVMLFTAVTFEQVEINTGVDLDDIKSLTRSNDVSSFEILHAICCITRRGRTLIHGVDIVSKYGVSFKQLALSTGIANSQLRRMGNPKLKGYNPDKLENYCIKEAKKKEIDFMLGGDMPC